jgi:hypothetical protein
MFSTTVDSNTPHAKKIWARPYQKYILVFRQSIRYSCTILMNLEFFIRFSKNTETSNFMKIRWMGAELFHAARQTDMTKLTVAFCNFSKAPRSAEGDNSDMPEGTEETQE